PGARGLGGGRAVLGSIVRIAGLLAPAPPPRPRRQPPSEEPEIEWDLHGIEIPELDFSQLRIELRALEKLRHLDLPGLRLLARRDEDPDEEDEDADASDAGRDRVKRERERRTRERERQSH